MRMVVPLGTGWMVRTPPAGSVSFAEIGIGIALVFQMSTDECPGRSGLVFTALDGPSEMTMALPLPS